MDTVRRHLDTAFRRPVADVSTRVFDVLAERLSADPRPRMLDAGCGTGAGTQRLALCHPQALIIGVDKSALRLAAGARTAVRIPNAQLVRCDLVDFWLLAARAGWRFVTTHLLYPNPWPKPEHLRRRWHAHAVLPALLATSERIELRTNWAVYAEELALALDLAGWQANLEALLVPDTQAALTPFERKYACSGHTLWHVVARAPGLTPRDPLQHVR